MSARRVCLFGGTFDPPHVGHLLIAQVAAEEWGADVVLFVPASVPPHKAPEGVSGALDRVALVEKAIGEFPLFDVSRIELDRPGPSFTADTVLQFREMWPDAKLAFLLGADMLQTFFTWERVQDLVAHADLLVAPRPQVDLESSARQVRLEMPDIALQPLDMPALDISSSWLRNRLAQNLRCEFLLPKGVAELIVQKGMYKS
ncbi:MAG: nicotinate-nucleotide adenylyltransferase [Firmicutes bacterium]|nr:nicotinate-nucleotide adenylyltransferase [Bacillota bacterium]